MDFEGLLMCHCLMDAQAALYHVKLDVESVERC